MRGGQSPIARLVATVSGTPAAPDRTGGGRLASGPGLRSMFEAGSP